MSAPPVPTWRLVDRNPAVAPDRLLAALSPPSRFTGARFDTYLPDPAFPSQAAALLALRRFAVTLTEPPTWRPGRRRPPRARPGVYLDGGFGVGKTHLLAALWHAAPTPKAYCTFVELTALVGALGFAPTVEALSEHRLLAIDEFELDDPGDTVLVSTLLSRLVGAGVRVAATSNTLPGSLGEGRFAARDFFREIASLAAHFESVRVEGEDYRHRGQPAAPPPVDKSTVVAGTGGVDRATCDDFTALLDHLARIHPSRYAALVQDVVLVGLTDVRPVVGQAAALRLVVLVDRLYDRDVPVLCSGVPLDRLFPVELLTGGHRKKYLRAVSRLVALARQGEPMRAPDDQACGTGSSAPGTGAPVEGR